MNKSLSPPSIFCCLAFLSMLSFLFAGCALLQVREDVNALKKSTVFVGIVSSPLSYQDMPVIVAAYSKMDSTRTIVHYTTLHEPGPYELMLPAGTYNIVAFGDKNINLIYDKGEPAGQSQTIAPEASTDAPPGQTELSNQGLEITPGPGTRKRPVPPLLAVEEFRLLVNGQPTRVPAGAALVVSPGDTLVIEGVIPTPTIDGHVKINFVGFVGNKSFNDADDRGYVIQTGNLMKRHALDAQGTIYRIEATAGKARVAEIFIRVRR